MTKEEAIQALKKEKRTALHENKVAFNMAIKALDQEPILDKIRAEIADLDDADYDYEGYYKAVTDALKIIDKYTAESEG